MDDLRNLKRRLRTRAPYKSDVQIMVEMLGPEPPVVILGQGDYPTAVQIADRVTADMNAAADAIEALRARIAELEAEAERRNEQIYDMIEASGQKCACGYDKASDVCLGHLPHFRKSVATARNDALEEAAEVADTCKRQNGPLSARGFENNYRAGIESGAEAIAAAIRAMKDAPTDTPPSSSHP